MRSCYSARSAGILKQHVVVQQITVKKRKTCAADGAGLAANHSFDDLRYDNTLQIVSAERFFGGSDDAFAHPVRETAVNNHR
ncbi:hypothetical protein D3C80_1866550 [compost metagenome]